LFEVSLKYLVEKASFRLMCFTYALV